MRPTLAPTRSQTKTGTMTLGMMIQITHTTFIQWTVTTSTTNLMPLQDGMIVILLTTVLTLRPSQHTMSPQKMSMHTLQLQVNLAMSKSLKARKMLRLKC